MQKELPLVGKSLAIVPRLDRSLYLYMALTLIAFQNSFKKLAVLPGSGVGWLLNAGSCAFGEVFGICVWTCVLYFKKLFIE